MEPDAVEIRVLGCLIEKQRTTPDVYPLTLNALRLACNQSTNRDPVVDYDENTIRGAIDRLVQRKWATLASWSNRRSMKYRHTLDGALGLDDAEIAVLDVLMLRGAQTPGELKTRTERLHRFAGMEELGGTLERLIERQLVVRLERRPGQREERYTHLLGSEEAPEAEERPTEPAEPPAQVARGRARRRRRAAPRADRAADRRAQDGAAGAPRTALGLIFRRQNPKKGPCPRSQTQEGDVRVHPIPAVEPSPRFAARVAAGIFAGEALILTGRGAPVEPLGWPRRRARGDPGRVRARRRASSTRARAGPAAAAQGRDRRSARSSCPCTCWSAEHEPALSGEMLYIWLGLYAAYFFSPRQAAAQLAFMAGAYLAVLVATTPPDAVAAGWLTLVGILFPAAGVLRAVRDGVTQLVSRLSEAALTDTLTGLKNRLALDRELQAEVERALQLGRAAERGDRRPRLLQVGERPARPPGRRRGARARRAGADAPPPGRRLDRPHRRRGVHDPAAGRDRARGLPRRRAHAHGGRARVPQRPRGAHVLVRRRHLPRPRPLRRTPCSRPPTRRSTRPRRSAATAA